MCSFAVTGVLGMGVIEVLKLSQALVGEESGEMHLLCLRNACVCMYVCMG